VFQFVEGLDVSQRKNFSINLIFFTNITMTSKYYYNHTKSKTTNFKRTIIEASQFYHYDNDYQYHGHPNFDNQRNTNSNPSIFTTYDKKTNSKFDLNIPSLAGSSITTTSTSKTRRSTESETLTLSLTVTDARRRIYTRPKLKVEGYTSTTTSNNSTNSNSKSSTNSHIDIPKANNSNISPSSAAECDSHSTFGSHSQHEAALDINMDMVNILSL